MPVNARAIAKIAVSVLIAPAVMLHAQAPGALVGPHEHHHTPKVELSLDYSHFGVGVHSDLGTTGNRLVGLNGGSASLALNFNRYFGIVGDFGGYASNQLELTGTGANQPRAVDADGTVYTYMGGPRLSYRNETRFTPFVQVLGGGVHASAVTVAGCVGSACTPLPSQNAFAMAAGGGLDIRLTHLLSLRAVQAEYMMTRFAAIPTGSNSSQNDLRLSSGIVLRFGGSMDRLPLQLACAVQPQSGFAGDPLTATATATNLNPKHPAVYTWTASSGKIIGTDASATIDTAGIAPGSYTVSGHLTQGKHAMETASCDAPFTILAPLPPTISCSASPASLMAGETATITAQGNSPQHHTLTYSYSSTSGQVTGTGTSATLATAGVGSGPITVTCGVVDDLGQSASAVTTVSVMAPPPPVQQAAVIPQTSQLCSVSFERDRKRPVRVDNEGKACLDDIALQLQRDSTSRLIVVGGFTPDEKQRNATERVLNERRYLTEQKGIDPQRIELRTGTAGGRVAANVFVPIGATYADDGSTILDPTTK